jgi:poly-D-alanine transfer protein DltD
MLFLITPKGSKVPVTSIKAIKGNKAILLGGDVVALHDEPQWITEHGTEDQSVHAIYTAMTSVVKEMQDTQDAVTKYNKQLVADMDKLRKDATSQLDSITREHTRIMTQAREALELANKAAVEMHGTSKAVRKLGDTLNGTIRQLEEAIATEHAL